MNIGMWDIICTLWGFVLVTIVAIAVYRIYILSNKSKEGIPRNT